MPFVPLHLHSEYSLLDGASQLPKLIAQVVEMGLPGLALTDHGVMYGSLELIKLCKENGIKPIVGNEMYVINGALGDTQKRHPKYHQIVLAKNTQGYKNLVKLTTLSHLQGFQGKGIFARPCINKEALLEYKQDLIVTSGCLAGEVPQAILQRRPQVAREVAAWYQEQFGDDYYLELQDHGSREDRFMNVQLVQIAQELGIKLIITNDSHFVSCGDVEAHDALLCIQTGKNLTETNRLRYSGTEYLKNPDEMRRLCQDHLEPEIIDQAIANTLEVLDKIGTYDIFGESRIPDYPIPDHHTHDSFLTDLSWQGLMDRCQVSSLEQITPEYQERLRFELDIIQQKGFSSYFLVVWDYIRHAREQGIPVGPGRGSAAGSLVAYALKITNIDPVHYGLLFERFLNPERKSMPDIDSDFCIERRGELIDYVTQKYGPEKVAQIITFNRMTSKAILKDVGRVLEIPYAEADKMAKLIPVSRGKPAKLK
ncbi:MAG: DNA polymerase III subunit alpha, partial [Cyanophyceae cyanobacterium]